MTTTCATCGEEHDEVRDVGYQLPDAIFALPEADRPARVVATSESCVLDGARCFVRCILEMSTPERGGEGARVGIGAWVELARADHAPLLAFAGQITDRERPLYRGRLANVFGRTLAVGEELLIKPWSATERPRLYVLRDDHPVAIWQRDGIPWDTWQRIAARAMPSLAYQRYHEREGRYVLRSEVATRALCACCQQTTVTVLGDVSFDGVRVARYRARFNEGHDGSVDLLLSVGDWTDELDGAHRVAIRLELRPEGTRVCDTDASKCPADFGAPLAREAALAHALVDDAFEISDIARDRDPVVSSALRKSAPASDASGENVEGD